MPIGIWANTGALIIGGITGSIIGNKLQKDFTDRILKVFGLVSIAMGVITVVEIENMPVVTVAMILGTILGEFIQLEKRFTYLAEKLVDFIKKLFREAGRMKKGISDPKFVSVMTMLCASGSGIFGSMQAGMTGDNSILLSKAALDIFSAIIFAASMGCIIIFISIPQFMVFSFFYYSASFILPLVSQTMMNDFSASAGILMIAAGLTVTDICHISVANMLPSLLIVMPLSAAWTIF